MKVDYMKRGWTKIKIKDNTHKNGRPTFINMERKLIKMIRYA